MKKILFSCALLILVLDHTSFGQKVYFSDTTNYWIVHSEGNMNDMPAGGESILSIADSIVIYGDKHYSLLMQHGYNGYTEAIALVRDDTAANVVYIKPLSDYNSRIMVSDTNEFIYMDYNLNPGDTLVMPLTVSPFEDSIGRYAVTGVDSVLMNAIWHKKFLMSSGYYLYEYIEGLGSLQGPMINNGRFEWGKTNLFCFRNRDTIPYNVYSYCTPTAVNEINNSMPGFELFPNPATGSFQINIRGKTQVHFNYTLRT